MSIYTVKHALLISLTQRIRLASNERPSTSDHVTLSQCSSASMDARKRLQ